MAKLDFSQTDKPRRIQDNLIAYMRLFDGLMGATMVDEDSLFWFISNKPAPGNIISRTRWTPDHTEANIDALFETLRQRTDGIGWFVWPGDEPADLSQRLGARGMPGGNGGNWLYADLTTLTAPPATPDGFHIERVSDDKRMAEWTEATNAGFGGDHPIFYEAYARHGYGPGAFSLHFTGYQGDTPVTSGTLLDAGGWATIYDLSTPPAFRCKGYGAALTHFLLQLTRDRGYNDTWIWSSDMAQSVYKALGFVEADFGLREHQWQVPQ